MAAKVGVVPFSLQGLDHGLVAAVLGYEHGIGVRSGCFCAQPYIAHLLRLDASTVTGWLDSGRRGDNRGTPVLVRISIACYNDRSDVDRAFDALERIVLGDIRGIYEQDREGTYAPRGYDEPLLFRLGNLTPAR